jgi:hypothetical protein
VRALFDLPEVKEAKSEESEESEEEGTPAKGEGDEHVH